MVHCARTKSAVVTVRWFDDLSRLANTACVSDVLRKKNNLALSRSLFCEKFTASVFTAPTHNASGDEDNARTYDLRRRNRRAGLSSGAAGPKIWGVKKFGRGPNVRF